MTTIVRLRRGAPWSRTTPPCGFPTAASANAVAFRHAAAGWTAATRARPVPRSGAGGSSACSPIRAAGPSGGATPRPSDGRRGARFTWHSGYPLGSGTRRSAAPAFPRGPRPGHQQGAGASERAADAVGRPGPSRPTSRAPCTSPSSRCRSVCGEWIHHRLLLPSSGRSCDTPRGAEPLAGRAATFLGCRETLT